LLCEDDSRAAPGAAPGADTVCVASNQYFAPLLARNPAYAARLAALFPQDGDMFALVARELFRPSAAVAAMRDAFKAEVGWAATYVVGLQLRTGGDFTDRGVAQPDWDLTLRAANALLPAARETPAAFFVATDIEWSRDAALVQLARNGTRVLEYGVFLRSNTKLGCQQALVDVLLLSEANDLITTAWSTFGYMAAGYVNARPAVITLLAQPPDGLPTAHRELEDERRATFMGVVMHDDRRTGAARMPTAEPCYHFLAYNARAIADATCYKAASEIAGQPLLEAWMRGGRYC
jgi:xyloglucan fucosyltransferase